MTSRQMSQPIKCYRCDPRVLGAAALQNPCTCPPKRAFRPEVQRRPTRQDAREALRRAKRDRHWEAQASKRAALLLVAMRDGGDSMEVCPITAGRRAQLNSWRAYCYRSLQRVRRQALRAMADAQ